jgi:hypothetical protein
MAYNLNVTYSPSLDFVSKCCALLCFCCRMWGMHTASVCPISCSICFRAGYVISAGSVLTWVTGPSAQSNCQGIQVIIDRDWERWSEATFEAEKTAIIHFTRKASRVNFISFIIKGETVRPKDQTVKLRAGKLKS